MASQADSPVEQTFEKDVNLIAYAGDDAPRILRNWVEEVTGVDVTSSHTERKTEWKLQTNLGGVLDYSTTLSDSYYDEDEIEEKKKELERADAGVSISKEVKEEVIRDNSLSDAASKLNKELTESLPEEIPGGFKRQFRHGRISWMDDNKRTAVKVQAPTWAERRILAKESNRSSDDLYESITEENSGQFNVKLEAESEEQLDKYTELVIEELHKLMSKKSGIGKVRYMECETITRKQGECYNI